MTLIDPVSASDAARQLGLSPARVRVMAAAGQLAAEKIGGRWLLERSEVELRGRSEPRVGRRFTSRNAWAVLQLLSEEEAADLSPSVRSRLKRMLLAEGLKELAPRLGNRATVSHYRAHPGELANVHHDPVLRPTGATMGAQFGVVPSAPVDGYLSAAEQANFVRRHALTPGAPTNVMLRVVPGHVWEQLGELSLPPRAAVALDLMEAWDPRLKEAGTTAVEVLEGNYREAAKARG